MAALLRLFASSTLFLLFFCTDLVARTPPLLRASSAPSRMTTGGTAAPQFRVTSPNNGSFKIEMRTKSEQRMGEVRGRFHQGDFYLHSLEVEKPFLRKGNARKLLDHLFTHLKNHKKPAKIYINNSSGFPDLYSKSAKKAGFSSGVEVPFEVYSLPSP